MKNSFPDATGKLDELRDSFNSRLDDLRSNLPSAPSFNLDEFMGSFRSGMDKVKEKVGLQQPQPANSLEHVADHLRQELDDLHQHFPATTSLDEFMEHVHERLTALKAAMPLTGGGRLEEVRKQMRTKMEELKRSFPSANFIMMEFVDYFPGSKKEVEEGEGVPSPPPKTEL